MRFHLLDRVESVEDGRIVAVKAVTQGEEYLADHFPTFPVLPGVLMLEAATQAAAWLAFRRGGLMEVADGGGYDGPTVAVLRSARNVRYGHFVAPGRSLVVTAELVSGDSFKVGGVVGDRTAITGKLDLACFRLADRDPSLAAADARLAESHRARWANLTASPVAFAD